MSGTLPPPTPNVFSGREQGKSVLFCHVYLKVLCALIISIIFCAIGRPLCFDGQYSCFSVRLDIYSCIVLGTCLGR